MVPCRRSHQGHRRGARTPARVAGPVRSRVRRLDRSSSPCNTISPPKSATACTLISGVVSGHDDDGRNAPGAGSQRNPLRVVAGRSANHAALRADRRQLRDFVVSAAEFLNEKTGWRSHVLNRTRLSRRRDSRGAASRAVSTATSYTLALRDAIYVVFLHGSVSFEGI